MIINFYCVQHVFVAVRLFYETIAGFYASFIMMVDYEALRDHYFLPWGSQWRNILIIVSPGLTALLGYVMKIDVMDYLDMSGFDRIGSS